MILSLKMTNFNLTYQGSNFDARKNYKKTVICKILQDFDKNLKISKNFVKNDEKSSFLMAIFDEFFSSTSHEKIDFSAKK